jgi:hypothetical protein
MAAGTAPSAPHRGPRRPLKNRLPAVLGWRDPDSNRGHHDFQWSQGEGARGTAGRGLASQSGTGPEGRGWAVTRSCAARDVLGTPGSVCSQASPAQPGHTQLISGAASVAVKRSPSGPSAASREAVSLDGHRPAKLPDVASRYASRTAPITTTRVPPAPRSPEAARPAGPSPPLTCVYREICA